MSGVLGHKENFLPSPWVDTLLINILNYIPFQIFNFLLKITNNNCGNDKHKFTLTMPSYRNKKVFVFSFVFER